jgi:hypothetical protein
MARDLKTPSALNFAASVDAAMQLKFRIMDFFFSGFSWCSVWGHEEVVSFPQLIERAQRKNFFLRSSGHRAESIGQATVGAPR